jgi:uncharacterized protein (UPF0548 family)
MLTRVGRLDVLLARAAAAEPTYAEVGVTRAAALDGAPLPPAWSHQRHERHVGTGRDVFERAADCVLSWGMHRGVGFGVRADGPRATPGTNVVVGIGRGALILPAPCRVVWSVDEPDRQGFGYATLPGHPESGEEAFVVLADADGAVRVRIVAFSRPGRWYTRLAGPAVPPVQNLAVRAYARAVERAARGGRS